MEKHLARIILLIFSFFSICVLAIAAVYGPYHEVIYLGTPEPGISAESVLKKYNHPLPNAPAVTVGPGDKVILCNGTACVTYTRTSTGWLGGPPVKQQVVDGGGGGGGGGGSGGGGWSPPPPPNDCSRCTVTVG